MGTHVFVFFFVVGLAEPIVNSDEFVLDMEGMEPVEVVTDTVAGEFITDGDGLGSVMIVGWDVEEEEGAADKAVLDECGAVGKEILSGATVVKVDFRFGKEAWE